MKPLNKHITRSVMSYIKASGLLHITCCSESSVFSRPDCTLKLNRRAVVLPEVASLRFEG